MPKGLNRDSGAGLNLVKTGLDELLDGATKQVAREGKASATDALIFTQRGASNAAVVTSVIGGGGYFDKGTEDNRGAKQANKSAPAPRVTQIAEFKEDMPIARTFMEDQQQDAVAKSIKQTMMAWTASQDRNGFYYYGNGFGTSLTIDGVSLYNNAHINNNGDTVDNLETGVMNDPNLNILIVGLRNQVNQTGVKVGYEPDFLLTSNSGHKDALSVAKSVLKAGGGDNDLNYYSEMYPGMVVKYNQFLDDISTTAYFVGTQGHDVIRFERESLNTTLVPWQFSSTDNFIYKLRAREEVDAITYEGSAASNGTV